MNKNIIIAGVVGFGTGFAIGATIAHIRAQKNVDEVRKYYSDYIREKSDTSESEPCQEPNDDTSEKYVPEAMQNDYGKLVRDLGYSAEDDEYPAEPSSIHVIAPSDYGEIENYETVELKYYADGILVDEFNEAVIDPASMVGTDFMDHFGDYEEDSVHIRNDINECDYEILRDLRRFNEFTEDGDD